MAISEADCLAKGWIWKNGTCQRPDISTIGMLVTRGEKCGGSSKRRRVRKPKELSLAVQDAILKAAEPKEKPKGKSGRN